MPRSLAGLALVRAILLAIVLVNGPAYGQDGPICKSPSFVNLADDKALAELDATDSDTVEFLAGHIEAQLGAEPSTSMSGGVLVRRGERLAGADNARYEPKTKSLSLEGNVRYQDPRTEITGSSAEFAYATGRIRFEGAQFKLGQNASRGTANRLEINEDGTLRLDDVSYTTCPPGSNDWLLEAGNIHLDTKEDIGSARNVKLRFQGIPILYTPYLSFPLGDARKSGILAPEFGTAGRSGYEVRVPWYWNIADNYDATITPRLLSDRGVQLSSEFRYLTKRNEGTAELEYLHDDNLVDRDRYLLSLDHSTIFDNGWRNRINFSEVSDSAYFEDLGGSLAESSITHLERSAVFDFYGEHWSLFGRLQDYQTIDEAIGPLDKPYRRLPQFLVNGTWPERLFGLRYAFDGELVYFDRDQGVTGWRLDMAPEIDWPLEHAGWFVTPGVAFEYTRYGLNNTAPGQPDNPDRALPIASLDAGLFLERETGSSEHWVQTLEPRILYVHVPYRDQDSLPVFDTIDPDLNLVQLYRKNRFLGVDRIGDTDKLSVGVTTRLLDVDTGDQLISATIGQALYLSEQAVTLPGQATLNGDSSDYIAEIGFLLYENLNFDIGHQWSTGHDGTTQSEARLQYRPRSDKILNLAYRFRRDSLEQGDVSWSWPLSDRWNFVGRYNYSFREDESLEQFYGFEYESCCWGIRLVSRRHISTRDGTRDSSIGLQLVLKGMTSVGTAADQLLERGILGYSSDIE